jgi:hypothetical protein
MAATPKNGFKVESRGNNPAFQSKVALYMEPSDFNYQQLKNQRDGGGYDNFLRSNLDNEQDKRQFANEAGRDMLPFRSYEGVATDNAAALAKKPLPTNAQNPNTPAGKTGNVDLNAMAAASVKNKLAAVGAGTTITATPGQKYMEPLRWNNPHASELEVNVWIMPQAYNAAVAAAAAAAGTAELVVPIRKPTCSGEGYQDNVFAFTIPNDFNQLGSKIPGFRGCKAVGDCVLQVYAHSVETRMYSMGTPLIVNGNVATATANDGSRNNPAQTEVGKRNN